MSPRIKKGYRVLTMAVWLLIALGGSVRAMNAGLACPDWPLCFGDIIPDYHPQVYFEFVHWVVAGLVSLATLFLGVVVLRSRQSTKEMRIWVWVGWVILATQVVFGGLTVLWQLQEKVVAAHLMLGTAFFGSILWLSLLLDPPILANVRSSTLRAYSWLMLATIVGQILLGGLVASHYAALVCTDFPTCHGQWVPTLSGIIGLHVIHRFGAYFTFLVVAGFWWLARRYKDSPWLRFRANLIMGLLLLQIGLGIANVLLYTPPLITVLHLATGAAIFSLALRINFALGYRADKKDQLVERPQASYNSPLIAE